MFCSWPKTEVDTFDEKLFDSYPAVNHCIFCIISFTKRGAGSLEGSWDQIDSIEMNTFFRSSTNFGPMAYLSVFNTENG